MVAMMDVTRRFASGLDVARYHTACPLALESRMRLSVVPGLVFVSTVESIQRIARLSSETFALPSTYRQHGQ